MKQSETKKQNRYWWHNQDEVQTACQETLRPGQACSRCHNGILAYDGLFLLACPVCGYVVESGVFS